MLEHAIRSVEVETESLGDIERGLRNDMTLIWSYFKWMKDEVGGLDGKWQNDNHDAFVNAFNEDADHLKSSLDSLHQLVGAFGKADEYYHKLQEQIAGQAAKLQ